MLCHSLSLPPASNNRAQFFTVFAEARLHVRNIATETDPQGLPAPLPLSDQCAELSRGYSLCPTTGLQHLRTHIYYNPLVFLCPREGLCLLKCVIF